MFQEGIAFGNPRSVYGYTDGATNKDWVIVEEQARVVRFIFEEFLLGKSAYKISKELNEKGILSPKGTKWQGESVTFILRNEKYPVPPGKEKGKDSKHADDSEAKSTGERSTGAGSMTRIPHWMRHFVLSGGDFFCFMRNCFVEAIAMCRILLYGESTEIHIA